MEQEEKVGMSFTGQMLAIHSAITRGIAVALENGRRFIEEAGPGDSRQGFSDFAHSLSSIVHAHHLAEDEVVFPFLRIRIPDAPYEKLSADHRVIELLVVALDGASERFKSGEDSVLVQITETLKSLDGLWHPHIKIEETYFSEQKLESLIAPEEHRSITQQISEHSQRNAGPPYLVLPFVLFNLAPEMRSPFSAAMPAELTEQLIPGVGKEQWAPMKPFLLE